MCSSQNIFCFLDCKQHSDGRNAGFYSFSDIILMWHVLPVSSKSKNEFLLGSWKEKVSSKIHPTKMLLLTPPPQTDQSSCHISEDSKTKEKEKRMEMCREQWQKNFPAHWQGKVTITHCSGVYTHLHNLCMHCPLHQNCCSYKLASPELKHTLWKHGEFHFFELLKSTLICSRKRKPSLLTGTF